MTSLSAPIKIDNQGLRSLWALEGRWGLNRVVRHADGREDRLTGEAHFRRSGPKLVQDEAGILMVDQQKLEAKQRYIWEAAGSQLNVYFADLRPFHSVALNTATPSAIHLCPPDRYEVAYDFSHWPKWRAVWNVEGPRKNYCMTSDYCRKID